MDDLEIAPARSGRNGEVLDLQQRGLAGQPSVDEGERRSARGGRARGSGSRSGPAPGTIAPRMRAARAPVQPGTTEESPCTVCHPMRAKAMASFASVGAPSSVDGLTVTPGSRSRSIAIKVGLAQPPPETTSPSTPWRRTSAATVSAVSAVTVATRSGVRNPERYDMFVLAYKRKRDEAEARQQIEELLKF